MVILFKIKLKDKLISQSGHILHDNPELIIWRVRKQQKQ